MNEQRAKELINCLLAQISEHIDWESKEAYMSWLTLEVGFSKEELTELDNMGFLPMPCILEKDEI